MENMETNSKMSDFVSRENNFDANLIEESGFANFHLKRKNEDLENEIAQIKAKISQVFLNRIYKNFGLQI